MYCDRDESRTRYRYRKGDENFDADVYGDGGELIVVLPGDAKGRRVPFSTERSVDETIRELAGAALDGYELASVDVDTIELDPAVVREMERTPISLKDGSYDKRSLKALILCLDLRRFSSFALEAGTEAVTGFLEKYSQELLAAATGMGVSYYKLLGDGAMLVWDDPAEGLHEGAVELFRILRQVVAEIGPGFGYKLNVAGALNVGEVYKYEINAECSGLKYRDYVSYAVNSIFRLQKMAGPGELVSGRQLAAAVGADWPLLDPDKKPARASLEGLRDEDYDEVRLIVPAMKG